VNRGKYGAKKQHAPGAKPQPSRMLREESKMEEVFSLQHAMMVK
jgi:hypothetical protein